MKQTRTQNLDLIYLTSSLVEKAWLPLREIFLTAIRSVFTDLERSVYTYPPEWAEDPRDAQN
jgi:hypothetical protein